MIKGQAGQIVNAQLKDTNGNPFTGACVVYVDGDNTGQVLGGNGGGVATNKGNGEYAYVVTAGDCAYNHVAFTFVPTGGYNATIQIDTLTPAAISALQTATGLASIQISDLLVAAAAEVSAVRFGGTLPPYVAAGLLQKFNRIIDLWNANPLAKYNVGFTSYTPTVSHSPHTIGPSSADWTATIRPLRITGANVILNSVTPAVRIPIRIRDQEWWLRQSVQALGSSIVTDLYYSPDFPNGNVYLWPVPTAAYPIELMTDSLFSNYQPTDVLWLPPGYAEALTLELAWKSAPSLGQTAPKELRDAARDAQAICFENNVQIRNVRTRDGGMPGVRNGRFLYRTGRMKNQ